MCGSDGLSNTEHREILETRIMKVTYDVQVDALRISFSNMPVEESDEDKPGVIID